VRRTIHKPRIGASASGKRAKSIFLLVYGLFSGLILVLALVLALVLDRTLYLRRSNAAFYLDNSRFNAGLS